jgi:hypothetical protein
MATEINIKSSTIEKGLDLAMEFLSKLISPSIDELGLMWSDNVKLWRLKLQIKNLTKVRAIVEEHNIDIRQVNLKVLVPYMEGVSLEEDETLQDIWANLFVNYIDASKHLSVTVYPSILSQLSSNDVEVLNDAVKTGIDVSRANRNIIGVDEDLESVANLVRLGLLFEEPKFSTYPKGDSRNGYENLGIEEVVSGKYYATTFGHNFYKACQR